MNYKNKRNYLKFLYCKNKYSILQNFRINNNKDIIINIIRFFIIIFALNIFYFLYNYQKSNKFKKYKTRYDIDFNYANYEKNIITTKIIKNSGWLLGINEAYFINGLIRKFKPKNCLEIGVARGGSSTLILNAIKDIPNSSLISLDLSNQLRSNHPKKIGYRVNQYFPELAKNWKLFTEKHHINF